MCGSKLTPPSPVFGRVSKCVSDDVHGDIATHQLLGLAVTTLDKPAEKDMRTTGLQSEAHQDEGHQTAQISKMPASSDEASRKEYVQHGLINTFHRARKTLLTGNSAVKPITRTGEQNTPQPVIADSPTHPPALSQSSSYITHRQSSHVTPSSKHGSDKPRRARSNVASVNGPKSAGSLDLSTYYHANVKEDESGWRTIDFTMDSDESTSPEKPRGPPSDSVVLRSDSRNPVRSLRKGSQDNISPAESAISRSSARRQNQRHPHSPRSSMSKHSGSRQGSAQTEDYHYDPSVMQHTTGSTSPTQRLGNTNSSDVDLSSLLKDSQLLAARMTKLTRDLSELRTH